MRFNKIFSVILVFIGVVILATIVGVFYQDRMTMNDMRAYPPIGKMIEVDGLMYHLSCMGAGSPTVILESGLGENTPVISAKP